MNSNIKQASRPIGPQALNRFRMDLESFNKQSCVPFVVNSSCQHREPPVCLTLMAAQSIDDQFLER